MDHSCLSSPPTSSGGTRVASDLAGFCTGSCCIVGRDNSPYPHQDFNFCGLIPLVEGISLKHNIVGLHRNHGPASWLRCRRTVFCYDAGLQKVHKYCTTDHRTTDHRRPLHHRPPTTTPPSTTAPPITTALPIDYCCGRHSLLLSPLPLLFVAVCSLMLLDSLVSWPPPHDSLLCDTKSVVCRACNCFHRLRGGTSAAIRHTLVYFTVLHRGQCVLCLLLQSGAQVVNLDLQWRIHGLIHYKQL